MSRKRVVLRCEGINNGLAMITVPEWQSGLSFFIMLNEETQGIFADTLAKGRNFFYVTANVDARMTSDLDLSDFQEAGSDVDYRSFSVLSGKVKEEYDQLREPW